MSVLVRLTTAEYAGDPALVLVRDSLDSDGCFCAFSAREWADFIRGVKAGRYDLERLEPLAPAELDE